MDTADHWVGFRAFLTVGVTIYKIYFWAYLSVVLLVIFANFFLLHLTSSKTRVLFVLFPCSITTLPDKVSLWQIHTVWMVSELQRWDWQSEVTWDKEFFQPPVYLDSICRAKPKNSKEEYSLIWAPALGSFGFIIRVSVTVWQLSQVLHSYPLL